MKNFFSIGGDVLLFSFLLIIFLTPLIVVMNLDPMVIDSAATTEKAAQTSNIAGVSEEKQGQISSLSTMAPFIIEKSTSLSSFIQIKNISSQANDLQTDLVVLSGRPEILSSSFCSLQNTTSSPLIIEVAISPASLIEKDIIIRLVTPDQQIVLFDGSNRSKKELTLLGKEKKNVMLLIDSPSSQTANLEFSILFGVN